MEVLCRPNVIPNIRWSFFCVRTMSYRCCSKNHLLYNVRSDGDQFSIVFRTKLNNKHNIDCIVHYRRKIYLHTQFDYLNLF